MKPVVLVHRNAQGGAFRYTRFAQASKGGRMFDTNAVELDSVPVGQPLPALAPADVELFRQDPERFLGAAA